MKHLLAQRNIELVAQVASSNVLLAFDFDGTLAPIVEDRDGATMRDRTRRLFRGVCERYPCAVISGRSRKDVTRRLDGAKVKYIVGNHGMEPSADLDRFASETARNLPLLKRALQGLEGVDLEDKKFSLAVHYRRSRRKREARSAIRAAATALPTPMRLVPGKLVVNLVPPDAPNKGDALLQLRELEQADTALYVGDDVTDEDVFTIDQPGRLLSIRIGQSKSSAAAYYLRAQREIDVLLASLLEHRERNR